MQTFSTLHSVFLGVIQGLTEFLPISSSGHLILAPYFFKFEDPGLAFDVALHIGSLLAILIFFWRDFLKLVTPKKYTQSPTLAHIVLGCIPAAVFGLLFEHHAEHAFRNPLLIALTLSVFALLLWYADSYGKKTGTLERLKFKDALIIGSAQALAIIPGVSRSGITITAALLLGFRRPDALRFSFLLSSPVIFGAGFLKLKHILHFWNSGGNAHTTLISGFLASLLSGLAALQILNWLVHKKDFKPFVVYRLCLSLVIVGVIVLR